ncbi:MAG: SurA N-terminal domain-containing protein [Desulfobacteraceae bacterium]|jgi:hypothetical protein
MGKNVKYTLLFFQKGQFVQTLSGLLVGIVMMLSLLFTACSKQPVDSTQTELLRVGSNILTVRQFKQIQDMSQDYYSKEYETSDHNSVPKALRLLNQIAEELLLKEKAAKLGLAVSDTELDAAVQNIKADYPGGTFEQVLLENAVSFDFWRQRLKVRLLIDKVIEKELESHVIITPEDISSYYKKHYAGISSRQENSDGLSQDKDINKMIIKRLRKLKAEEAYAGWIKELQQTYPVQVNWEVWNNLNAS